MTFSNFDLASDDPSAFDSGKPQLAPVAPTSEEGEPVSVKLMHDGEKRDQQCGPHAGKPSTSPLARCEEELSELRARLAAIHSAALADKAVTHDYAKALHVEIEKLMPLRDAHELFVAQIEDLIAATQVEAAALEGLIYTVQSSRFWRFKRYIGRLASRMGRHR